jgi:NAD(P)H-hydrate repair Nnr-like enzyme with NAD(P)H-hydrate epimerase domain
LRASRHASFQEIFQRSRNNSKKVLFLITDGFSNGGDPIPLANELKKKQVTIFTIGIQNGNYKELYELASSPGEFYSYLLDSFQEFENLARRALHVG